MEGAQAAGTAQAPAQLPSAVRRLIDPPTAEGLSKYIIDNNCRKILVMLGAGVSVAAGIPDFRSPGTGLYAQIAKMGLSRPEEVFDLELLKERPEVFFTMANDMHLWPGQQLPTRVHHFMKLLADEGRLLCACTQNIDTLERQAGLDDSNVVEAHGSFATGHCMSQLCRAPFPAEKIKEIAMHGGIPRCEKCGEVAKPGVVFFGENLPPSFMRVRSKLAPSADLLLVIGTSLQVQPFASLASCVPPTVPRVLINMHRVGDFELEADVVARAEQRSKPVAKQRGGDDDTSAVAELSRDLARLGLDDTVVRDMFLPGDCQSTVTAVAEGLGLGKRLDAAVASHSAVRTTSDI